jgi:hypothetical protein
MYTTLFDSLDKLILDYNPTTSFAAHLLSALPRWQTLPGATRALIAGLIIILVTLGLGSVSLLTGHAYVPLILLGVFYGAVSSKLLTQFLGPKIQSAATGFLGGVTAGNIGSKEATLRTWIRSIADAIKDFVTNMNPGTSQHVQYLNQGLVWCVWMAIVTALVILAANAYYANVESSPVGELKTAKPQG